MLGKLLKHEFIATGRIMGALYGVALLIMGYLLSSYYIAKQTASNAQLVGIMLLLVISSCSFVLTAVVMVMNFQKSLYNEQGYLSFTLPVKSVSLLASKVIVSTVWFFVALACLFATVAISVRVIREDIIGEETYATLESLLPMLLGGKSVTTIVTTIIFNVLSFFVSFAMVTIELYFAITLANTRHFQKRYVLWTIVFALVVIGAASKVAQFFAKHVDFGISILGNEMSIITESSQIAAGASFINLAYVIASVVIGIVFFYATFYVMHKKVNIR